MSFVQSNNESSNSTLKLNKFFSSDIFIGVLILISVLQIAHYFYMVNKYEPSSKKDCLNNYRAITSLFIILYLIMSLVSMFVIYTFLNNSNYKQSKKHLIILIILIVISVVINTFISALKYRDFSNVKITNTCKSAGGMKAILIASFVANALFLLFLIYLIYFLLKKL